MQLEANSAPLILNTIARLQHDQVRGITLLLLPEMVVELNETAAYILSLCDGAHEAAEIIALTSKTYQGDEVAHDSRSFLEDALRNRWIKRA
ncbi:MAG: pyrroloquinoline quinone biosynthesis peptide chaperone PqqD [Candidatus Obscuribacterales bacterium]|nr:pyrroloquinoline quinone biosynthesis peptide chaperone PqqD [Candidatus Obscuribacterales bacterium]